jgi:betaine-homocysteine S-methyltransferase
MGEFAKKAKEIGVNYIGGCCGCQGAHIRQMARELGKMPEELREWSVDYENPQSATEAYKEIRESQ